MSITSGGGFDVVRWAVTVIVAGIVGYFTVTGAIQAQLAVIAEREANHYQELIKRLDRMELKIDQVR